MQYNKCDAEFLDTADATHIGKKQPPREGRDRVVSEAFELEGHDGDDD
jgi:hypothetical protein